MPHGVQHVSQLTEPWTVLNDTLMRPGPWGLSVFLFCGEKGVKIAKFKSGFRGYSIIFVDNYKKEIDETDKNQ